MSTKMELTKEVEKLLSKARSLKLRNEAYFQQSKSQTSSSNTSSQLSFDITSNFEDDEDVHEDFIDVNAVDLTDSETWLFMVDSPSQCEGEDPFQWIRHDVEEAKDSRYQGRQILLQYELARLTNKLGNNIDSRTFTRPKKKMTRPSLESINSTFKYAACKNSSSDDFTDSTHIRNKDCSDLRLSLLRNSDTFRKKPSNESIYLQDFYKNTNDDIMVNIQRISNKIKEVENSSNSCKLITKNSDLSSSLENIIRDQIQKLDVKTPNFQVDEVVQNVYKSPVPNLMTNSGFGSSNFTSLTESDFINAESQPQDLFTSYTSTIATDLAEDQREVIQSSDETYSRDIHNLCETISKDINSKIQDTTFVTVNTSQDLEATHIIEDESINNITYIESPNYIGKHIENSGSGDNNKERNNVSISNKPSPKHIVENSSTKILSETNIISCSESEKEFIETDTEKSYCDGSGDNHTFTKLSASNKISLSDPNLREPKNMHDNNHLNRTFDQSNIRNISIDSSDSLDLNSSFSSINSSRISAYHGDFDTKAAVNGKNKFLFQRRLESTPKMQSKLVKQSWASIETLSPISNSSPKREQRYAKSAQNIASNTFSRNMLSDTKVLNSVETRDPQQTFRRIDKENDTYRTTEDVSSLQEMQIPTMIVKPMEVKKTAVPSTGSSGDLKMNSTVTVTTQNKQSCLRQPVARSGLPRPTSTTSIVSGIPRPQSRLPVPRSLKAPASGIAKPVIPTKNNWMDGCY